MKPTKEAPDPDVLEGVPILCPGERPEVKLEETPAEKPAKKPALAKTLVSTEKKPVLPKKDV